MTNIVDTFIAIKDILTEAKKLSPAELGKLTPKERKDYIMKTKAKAAKKAAYGSKKERQPTERMKQRQAERDRKAANPDAVNELSYITNHKNPSLHRLYKSHVSGRLPAEHASLVQKTLIQDIKSKGPLTNKFIADPHETIKHIVSNKDKYASKSVREKPTLAGPSWSHNR